jgi:hypothetical protein
VYDTNIVMISLLRQICDKLGFEFLNRHDSPSNKLRVKDSSKVSSQQAGGNINNILITTGEPKLSVPRLDFDQWGGTGGADGWSVTFYLINVSGFPAFDIHIELIADDLSENIELPDVIRRVDAHTLSRAITYKYDMTDFYLRKLRNPIIRLKYKSLDGGTFTSDGIITQKQLATGRFDIHSNSPTLRVT